MKRGRSSTPSLACALLVSLLFASACSNRDNIVAGSWATIRAGTCEGERAIVLKDTISDTLTAARGPYVLEGPVVWADSLVVEAGTLLCAESGTVLKINMSLSVNGTPDAPVRFTAADSTAPWGGIQGGFTTGTHSYITSYAKLALLNAVIDHARTGIAGGVDLEGVDIRATEGAAVSGWGTVTDAVLDSACASGSGCAAVISSGLTLSGVTIRDSGGDGVSVDAGGGVLLSGVTIDNPAGTGISMAATCTPYGGTASLYISGPVSVHGQGGYIFKGPGGPFAGFMAAYADSARPGDRVLSVGSGGSSPLTIPAGVSWSVDRGSACFTGRPGGWFGPVTLGPGATVQGPWLDVRGLQANGTPDEPVHLAVRHMEIDSGAVTMSNVAVGPDSLLIGSPNARIERLASQGGTLILSGAGARLDTVSVVSSPGDGIEISADSVRISTCTVSGSAQDGIHVSQGKGVVVTACNLEANRGFGAANDGPDTVMARGNWWGDPAGPSGPNGDGVSGAVDVGNWLTAWIGGGVPVSVTVTASPFTVPTGDTVRFIVDALDASGLSIWPGQFDIRALDTLTAASPSDPFLRLARIPGAARVEAVFKADTTIRAEADFTVVEGGPLLNWDVLDLGQNGQGWRAVVALSRDSVVALNADPPAVYLWDNGVVRTLGSLPALDCPSPGLRFVDRLAGTGIDDLWAALRCWEDSARWTVLSHWDGSAWNAVDSVPSAGGPIGIWALSPNRVFVLSDNGLSEWDGAAWSDVQTAANGTPCQVFDFDAWSPEEAYALCFPVGQYITPPGYLLQWKDGVWTTVEQLPSTDALLWRETLMVGPGGELRVLPSSAGQGGDLLLRYGAWTAFPIPFISTSHVNYGVGTLVGTQSQSLWFVGPGERWSTVWIGPDRSGTDIFDVGSVDGAIFLATSIGILRGSD